MLLEFRTKNYKSFVDETVFSLTAAPKQTGLDYSLLKEKVKGKTIKGLCSSVIYGPNAAGKTNIIGAMDVFRSIVLRGNIRNSEEKVSPNPASGALELIPNNKLEEPDTVDFSIDFLNNGLFIHYYVSMDLGGFLDADYPRKIVSEDLVVNGECVFKRNKELKIGSFKSIQSYMADSLKQNVEGATEIAKNSLNLEELFLINGFKLIFSPSFVKMMTDWLTNQFMIIYRADSMQLIKRFADPQKQTVYLEKTTNKAAKLFGINSNAVGYVVSEEDSDAKLCSIFNNIKDKKNAAMAAELFESYGTIRFINMFPLVIRAIQTGGTLVVDEFDASIHPMALMSIINVFHNDDINIHQAQLVFNTHNPIFLNSNLFRRDEIKFVERDDESHHSILYSLSDFGTTGEKGVRKHEDYMKNYFVSQYGAIKNIDFTPIFEEMLSNGSEG
ncbi:AAA family ATPase [Clostridium sp. Marseille-P2415]|uniref:AAA family ATPase n=1 Tax=Clostridium sp. Marseille-P2415 TaxID=1805471 RepID=UPI00098892E9|nr:ATP-binding protein [Clostridium sp. Marseille-P2415]